MPELKAQLNAKLDASALVNGLIGTLGGHGAQLQAISVPASEGELSQVGGNLSFDGAGISAAASQMAAQAATQLQARAPATDVIRRVSDAVDVVKRMTDDTLSTQLGALAGTLKDELEGTRDGGFIGVLLRIANVLGDAPEGQELRRLLAELLGLFGVDFDPASLSLGDVPPAIAGVVSALGGLMSMESVLAEAEHLAGVMSAQLVPAKFDAEVAQLDAAFRIGSVALDSFIVSLDTSDPMRVELARQAIARASASVEGLLRQARAGMGFGEATLVHLDMPRVTADVSRASTLLHGADLDPAGRLMTRVVDKVRPLVTIDMSGVPSFSINDLFAQAESRIGELTATIAAFDSAKLVQPLSTGIGTVTDLLGTFTDFITSVTLEVRAAIDAIRAAIASLPIGDIADAIRTALQPITQALDAIRELVATIKAALETAANAAKTAIGAVEGTLDDFKAEIEALFGQAQAFVETLNIDAVAGAIADRIQAFADELAKAQMKPYFDTAVDAIGTAADVISAVPFGLLPESMKSEVDAAVAPIKNTDASAVAAEIESLLQISPDGKFELRDDIELALTEIQAKFDELLEEVKKFDPHKYVQQLDEKLIELGDRIRQISPELTLQPVQDAIDSAKGALNSFDPATALQPVQEVFTDVLAAIDEYSPSRLITPIEQKVDEARDSVVAKLQLDQWEKTIDDLVASALAMLDRISPEALEPPLQRALGEVRALVELIPDVKLGSSIGGLIALLYSGSGLRIYGWSFDPVTDWIGGVSGTQALEARAQRLATAVQGTLAAVQQVDLGVVLGDVTQRVQRVRAAVDGLPASPARDVLQEAVSTMQNEQVYAQILANRQRYLALLTSAAAVADTLRRTGFSEVDQTALQLKTAFAPVFSLTGQLREVLDHMGLHGSENGLRGILGTLLDEITPARLIGLILPVFAALRGRVQALLDEVATPIKAAIVQLRALIASIDLTPLREAVDGVVNEAKTQIASLSPEALLHDQLAAYSALKTDLLAFNPLADVLSVLDELKAAVERVLSKLRAEELLASPLAIYDHIIGELDKLDITHLLDPVLDELDDIARQVDEGLDATVAAFQELQDALPSGGGGSTLDVGVSLAVA